MFAEMQQKSSGGGGSLKDIIYDKVFNGGFTTTYNIVTYSTSRATVSEGKVAIDTTNRKGYAYVDATLKENATSPYVYLKTSSRISTGYLPYNYSGGKAAQLSFYTDDSSTQVSDKIMYYNDSNGYIYGNGSANDHIISYIMWSY